MRPVRVLVVDDSASMRALIAHKLSSDPTIQVVGQAADPLQARDAIKALNPDVMTLDVEMPKMNGLEFLEKVMRLRPLPVLMVSSLTERGASATINAMEIGAIDCIAKPSSEHPDAFDDLPAKVKMAAQARVGLRVQSAPARPTAAAAAAPLNGRIVAIGASTGGVEAVLAILSSFPKLCAPTVVTLHLPTPFTKTFVQRLDRLCQPEVREATHGAPLAPGRVYIAPGTYTHLELSRGETLRCVLRGGDAINGHRPSVDALFQSVAKVAGAKSVGVILTGMGSDGARGLLEMRKAGARTIGQDEATCVVYGMPKSAFQMGAVERQSPLNRIAADIGEMTSSARARV
jgi:two-component system, chemotaxis family, protein-glutamate methylesterase/glutaminase